MDVKGSPVAHEPLAAPPDPRCFFLFLFSFLRARLTLGGDGDHVTHTPVQWTDMLPASRFYEVALTTARLGDTALATALGETVIIDSGTSDITLKADLYDEFMSALVAQCAAGADLVGFCRDAAGTSLAPSAAAGYAGTIFGLGRTEALAAGIAPGHCFALSDAQIARYPSLAVTFPGAGGNAAFELVLPPSHFIQDAYNNCARGMVRATVSRSSALPETVFGDSFLDDFLTVFNLTSRQVGFAKASKCSFPDSGHQVIVAVALVLATAAVVGAYAWFQHQKSKREEEATAAADEEADAAAAAAAAVRPVDSGAEAEADPRLKEFLPGTRVSVLWPAEGKSFPGKITAVDAAEKTAAVNYDDGDVDESVAFDMISVAVPAVSAAAEIPLAVARV